MKSRFARILQRPVVLPLAVVAAVLAAGVLGRTPFVGSPPCAQDPADIPPATRPDGRPANYLHTCYGRLYDAHGTEVTITGVNWFGMETGTYAPHGLWARQWESILDQVADLGYNTIRLPYSNDLLRATRPEGINYQVNPDLAGLSGLEVLDRIIAGAGERGLRVILDRHRPTAEAQAELWYTEEVSEAQWIADWEMLAARYRGNDTVIGADLHNEPRGEAAWGTDDPATDWRLAAERAGNAILAVNPHWLIIVEGVERHGDDWYWWGGNLQGAREHPVRLSVPNRLVYSAHDYGPGVFQQGWFSDSEFPANLDEVWDRHWGYLVRSGEAPVLLGEFGGRSVDGGDVEGQWQRALLEYLKDRGVGFVVWSLNPNSSDTGGLLSEDWVALITERQEVYRPFLAPPIPGPDGEGPPDDRSPIVARYRNLGTDRGAVNAALEVQARNRSGEPVPLDRVELRYWLLPDVWDTAGLVVEVDWAEAGRDRVRARIGREGSRAYVAVTFDRAAGELPPYGSSGAIGLRVHRRDWLPLDREVFGTDAGLPGWQCDGVHGR